MVATVEVDENGDFQECGSFQIPGLQDITGSEIKIAFVDPTGSVTGRLFPTGNPCDYLTIPVMANDPTGVFSAPLTVRATLLDAANPFVLVDASTLPPTLQEQAAHNADDAAFLALIEDLRREGAVRMGVADSVAAAAQVRGTPKIALVWAHTESDDDSVETDVFVRSFSMGKPHPSLQLTGAVCIGAGVCLPGTVPGGCPAGTPGRVLPPTPARTPSPGKVEVGGYEQSRAAVVTEINDTSNGGPRRVRIKHPTGVMDVEVVTQSSSTDEKQVIGVDRCVVSRTARRLFEGKVYFYL